MQKREYPYKNIGERLRKWRERVNESIAEAAGAVEIDAEDLKNIETGAVLPSEDILLLLVSHLEVQEKEAKVILEQAGYSRNESEQASNLFDEQLIKQMLMIIPFDNRILYSDSVNISANQNGVVFNFMQGTGNPQPVSIARIGMSLEHAKSMQQLLTDILAKTTQPQRLLEPPQEESNKKVQ